MPVVLSPVLVCSSLPDTEIVSGSGTSGHLPAGLTPWLDKECRPRTVAWQHLLSLGQSGVMRGVNPLVTFFA